VDNFKSKLEKGRKLNWPTINLTLLHVSFKCTYVEANKILYKDQLKAFHFLTKLFADIIFIRDATFFHLDIISVSVDRKQLESVFL